MSTQCVLDSNFLLAAHELGHAVHALLNGAHFIQCTRTATHFELDDGAEWILKNPPKTIPAMLATGFAAGAAGEHILGWISQGVPASYLQFELADRWHSGTGFWTPSAESDAEQAMLLLPNMPGGKALVGQMLTEVAPMITATLGYMGADGLWDLGTRLRNLRVGQSIYLPLSAVRKAITLHKLTKRRFS